eukprot:CAMPEP_0170411664 /NCGR_PEP_ID=MMETSP0117_2-20130122/30541_1 /TAXON_ID=400756 /ORGANISM="Durinskia baltica, Strain CSIRO CS-38" /LENGTH=46 /DNA_ID= /DNA_START= /DNA_END= /DNA_ORIENTATION=
MALAQRGFSAGPWPRRRPRAAVPKRESGPTIAGPRAWARNWLGTQV